MTVLPIRSRARAARGDHHLVVGVDFGTTYTGVAFASSDLSQGERIEVISTWPAFPSWTHENTNKVPSEFSCEHCPAKWGYELEPWMSRHGWFKLLLDPEAGDDIYYDIFSGKYHTPPNKRLLPNTLELPPCKSPVDACSQYLAEVYKHTMKTLEARFPALRTTVIRFVITAPTIWGFEAQNGTLKAAKKAGFGSRTWPNSGLPLDMVEMVADTEAAAIYSLKNFHKGCIVRDGRVETSQVSLTPGTQVVVCDAGGGTVDLAAYEINQVQPQLAINETIRARGGLHGATSLDRAFLKLLDEKLGAQGHLLTAEHRCRGSKLMDSWEIVKRLFGVVKPPLARWLRHDMKGVHDDPENGVFGNSIKLEYAEMMAIFQPTIRCIVDLVDDMVFDAKEAFPKVEVAGIILTGGFCDSSFLRRELQKLAEEYDIPLIKPESSWTAAVKGAVSYGLNPISNRRILQWHYGIDMCMEYDANIHNPVYNFVSPWDEKRVMNSDTVYWFANMGAAVGKDQRFTVPFEWCGKNIHKHKLTVQLRTCCDEKRPISRRSEKAIKAPIMTVDPKQLPDSMFEQRTNSKGQVVYKTQWTMEMLINSAGMTFQLRDNKGNLVADCEFD